MRQQLDRGDAGAGLSTIPDDAFQPVTGDDKAMATALRRRNKREREGQLGLRFDRTDIATPADLQRWRETQLAQVTTLNEDDVAQLHAKEAAYADYLAAPEYAQSRLLYDLWTAAFFWPLPPGDADRLLAPTHQALVELRAGHPLDAELIRQVRKLAARHQFFHWALAFPEVFAQGNRNGTQIDADETQISAAPLSASISEPSALSASSVSSAFSLSPGFDVMLSNPPWERIKLQEKEWFAVRSPAIANAPNAAARRRLIDRLATEDPALAAAFQSAKAGAENESHFIRNSNAYPLCGRGDVNTYAVFAELARHLIADQGRAGVIVPTGIATDDTTKYFFQDLMKTASLASLASFENERKIFPDVHNQIKFCLLTITGLDAIVQEADFFFFARAIEDLRDANRHFTLATEDIELINPNSGTCATFRYKRDAEITKAIYRRVPILRQANTVNGNAWDISFVRQFDMANDSHLFYTPDQLRLSGFQLTGNQFICDTQHYLPLYEAKLFYHFDHRYSTYDGASDAELNAGRLPKTTAQQKLYSNFVSMPRYWVSEEDINSRITVRRRWYFSFRDVTNSVSERTSIFSVLPWSGVGHTAPLVVLSETVGILAELCFLCNANSFVFDYIARQKLAGSHMSFTILYQLPFLPPDRYSREMMRSIAEKTLELTYTSYDLKPFAQDILPALESNHPYAIHSAQVGDPPPFRWDEERRFLLRCELDAAYFHLYGIARDEVAYILDTFPIVKRKEIAAYGEYRTQRVILAIYDEMATAMRTGVNYQTRLDPPPADPRVAHAPQR